MPEELERGPVTFLFSDIEGSTRLWELHDSAMELVLARHDEIAQDAVTGAGGSVFKHTGDGLAAAFASPVDALAAAIRIQRDLSAADWGAVGTLRARMGIHSGEAQQRDGDYFGRSVNRCARLMAIAHGGQVLVSGSSAGLIEERENSPWRLVDLGRHQLKDLSRPEQVFQLEADGLLDDFAALRTVDTHPRSLPQIRRPPIGRAAELESLARILESERLVTLVGPAGVGKTRLAVAAGEAALPFWPDGVWLCHMSTAGDTRGMAASAAEVLSIEITDPENALKFLVAGLGDRKALLLLDSCEGDTQSAAELAETILDSCPEITLLVTSRERLRAQGERVVSVGPLEVPPIGVTAPQVLGRIPAVQLFLGRAADAALGLELDDQNAEPIAEICRRLDGLPLALELAAAQTATLDPADILERLEGHIAKQTTRSGLVSPQQTLEGAVDWSYSSLTDQERQLFARVSVFDGGFDVPAAEEVCARADLSEADIAAILGGLVEKSMVAVRRDGGSIRYWMFGVLREFAAERLSELDRDDETRTAHLHRYLRLARESVEGLASRDEAEWVERMELEFRNIRAAQRWAIETDRLSEAAELICATYPFAFGRIRYEIIDWAEALLESFGPATHPLLPQALAIVGWGAAVRGDLEASADYGARAAALDAQLGSRSYLPYRVQVVAAMLQGDLEKAGRSIADGKLAAASGGDDGALIEVLGLEAFIHAASGDQERAGQVIEAALEQARQMGNPSLLAWCLYQLGAIQSETRPAEAAEALDHAMELAALVGNRYIGGIALMVSTHVHGRSSDVNESLTRFGEVIGHWYQAGNSANLSNTIWLFANFLADHGYDETAAVIVGALTNSTKRAPQSLQTGRRLEAIPNLSERVLSSELQHLATRGAVLSQRELVEYCHREIERLSEESATVTDDPSAVVGG